MDFDQFFEELEKNKPEFCCATDFNKSARIKELEKAIRETIEDNLHLADGEVCTLIKLKRAINCT